MKANEINLNRFLSQADTVFTIPVYQRNYDWTKIECKQLLDDILDAGKEDKVKSHFLGSIVYIHDGVYSTAKDRELTIIDGQQRLTTLTLIYLVILSVGKKLGNTQLVDRTQETYLINKFSTSDKLKLRQTKNNQDALRYLVKNDPNEEYKDYSRIIENYNYFKSRISEENIDDILNGLDKIIFVEVSLERDKDDSQRIFESLNSTGLALTEGDLIRNYILMGLKSEEQNKIYENYWKHIEKSTIAEDGKSEDISAFIRDFLTMKNKSIPNKNKVYREFKNNYEFKDIDELEKALTNIKKYANYYNKLIQPKNESDKDIRLQIVYINKLEINVVYPFLLQVYDDYHNNIIEKQTFIEVLELIQSYTWRRFILGLPTNALNKVFMRMYDEVDKLDYINSLKRAFKKKKGSLRFPSNREVISTLKEKDMYGIHRKNKNYYFQRMENFNNNEPVDIENNTNITIEHIFPQNPDIKWKKLVEESEYKKMEENYLHTVQNLTLSGNNGALSNKYFTEKRDMNKDGGEQGYKFSRLWLNKHLSTLDKWDLEELDNRFELIQDRFLKIWKPLDVKIDDDVEYTEENIFDAEEPTHKKLDYIIFFDDKIDVKTVSDLYKIAMKTLFEKDPHLFFGTELENKIYITKDPKELRSPLKINDTYYIESNLDSKGKFDRIKLALSLFGDIDELYIKYSNE